MRPIVSVHKIVLTDSRLEGSVIYRVESDRSVHFMRQPFHVHPAAEYTPGFVIYEWDGNEEAPTLTPAYDRTHEASGVRLHLDFAGGRIKTLSNSVVASNPLL